MIGQRGVKPRLVSYLWQSNLSPVWVCGESYIRPDGFIDHNCAVTQGAMCHIMSHICHHFIPRITLRTCRESSEERKPEGGQSAPHICIYILLSSSSSRTMSVYTATLLEDMARREEVAAMMRAGDWRAVIKTFEGGEKRRDPLLVWIRPSILCLNFIKSSLSLLGLNSISSVGCGNGLLGKTRL